MFNNKQKTDDLCEVGCAAKGFAVGAENADEVIFGLLKWAGKGADRASENSDKKCSISVVSRWKSGAKKYSKTG